MRDGVLISMRNGERFVVVGYADDIQRQVNGARGEGRLIPFERDSIPTGQQFYLDPDEIVAVRSNR
jgi:hypothetical protein